MIVSDNGIELTSNVILAWQEERGVDWHYIVLGKPMLNGFVFKRRRVVEECLIDLSCGLLRQRTTTPENL